MFKRILFSGLLISLAAHASAESRSGDWLPVGTDNGVSVYRKEVPGDPIFAFRGEGTLKAPLGKVITVTRDVARNPEWVNRLKIAHVIREISPTHRIVYLRFSAPWPVADRDFVIDNQFQFDREKNLAVIDVHSVEEPSLPPDPCCVRGEVHLNHIELRAVDDADTAIVAEADVDPRGAIPSWVVNLIQKTFPRKSIEGLLRQSMKPDIRDFFAGPSSL